MLKNLAKGFWFMVLPMMILGVLGIAMYALGKIPLYYLTVTLVMWVLVSGLGIAVGYHRIFSHRTHELSAWQEKFILFFATFAGQGSPIFWVAVHRGYHHPHSDSQEDPHSPQAHGRWHAFAGWLIASTEATNRISVKYAADLLRKPHFVWFHRHYMKIVWLVPLLVFAFDWRLAFAAFWIPGAIALIQDNGVNVYGHVPTVISYRNFPTGDHSVNNPWFGYLGWGQGWHNNHHHRPGAYDFGSGVSGRWWEWDPCRIFLPVLGPARAVQH